MNRISNPDEVQFRIVHPNFVKGGGISHKAFLPKREHGWRLSMSRSKSTTAREFYEFYISSRPVSVEVFGLMPGEFSEEPFPIECYSSPSQRNPNHSHADFSGLTHGQIKRKARILRDRAKSRGRLHP